MPRKGHSYRDLLGGLTRVVDGVTVLDATNTSDAAAANIRNQVLADATSGINWTGSYSSDKGNLTQLADGLGNQMDLTYDARRRISSVTHAVPGGSLTYNYLYDLENRRLRADVPLDNSGTWTTTERVYAFQGSRVIAIGDMDASSTITWTHGIGWGPMGPVFIDDLTAAGNDYYLFTDHLGTPFGHHNPTTDTTYHTPTNPWGELLATHPAPAPHYTAQGTVATSGAGGPAFTLPPDATHVTSPLGLAGHLYDHHTGLVYMHNRHYHPRLGHFTTPDYRAPDIYDPTTYTEPYAYAAGNPVMFWDLTGLAIYTITIRSFAPFEQFGGGYHGDDRTLSVETIASARIHMILKYDSETGKILEQPLVFSSPTHHPWIKSATGKPEWEVLVQAISQSTSIIHTYYAGAIPRPPYPYFIENENYAVGRSLKKFGQQVRSEVTPNIDVFGEFFINFNQNSKVLNINTTLHGDGFPATEVFITDPSGQSIFLAGSHPFTDGFVAPKLNPFTMLWGTNYREIDSQSLRVYVDAEGNFKFVVPERGSASLDYWNELFLKERNRRDKMRASGIPDNDPHFTFLPAWLADQRFKKE